ncbi:MAG: hypothetical protein WBN11_09185 [Eudoraea sp.]
MGITKDKRKFNRKTTQTNPTNPTGNTNVEINQFDLDSSTIRKQKNKK